ncbi:hypothetical protein HU200_054520 [Digitaria exilis]|uniref:Uncharacterized protein n=1 Tax=Digitaria exilis TaxID=1010633 RepID=A0A835E5L0_9POAL|nr:hypothetical protein HU200_054520 [Digitaria exilis]
MPSDVAAASTVHRVVRPTCWDMPSSAEQDDESARLLSKIDSHYASACDRLTVRGRPAAVTPLARFFLDAGGVCIGFLDPVSNVIINTACTSPSSSDDDLNVLAGAAAVEHDEVDLNAAMCRRSLDGLVAFLVYFFPYLAGWEAVRYLLAAGADLLAAARLIVADRGMAARFPPTSAASSPAFEAALDLAAQISKHPQPKRLVHVWMSLSSRSHQVLALLSRELHVQEHHSPREELERCLRPLLDDDTLVVPSMAIPWDLAGSRSPCCVSSSTIADVLPYQHTRSLRMVLLDTIHGFYLRAMARLPGGELRSRLHRSLLRGGYCYGPMDDPRSNIILNTIWYEANFPSEITPVLDVIGPKSLTRLVSRSFYGLVSFLQTRYHYLSEHQAVQCLVSSSGQLSVADPNFFAPGNEEQQRIPSASIKEAYEAAATAAWHPKPEQQAAFLASCSVSSGYTDHMLSLEEVQCLYKMLSPNQPPVPERICSSSYHVKLGKWRSEAQERRVSRKKPEFDLHIICCVNEDVCGPEYCEEVEDCLSVAPCKYKYSHVNFLAAQKGSLFSDSCPILFFAEFDNEEDDGAPLFCCQVNEPTPFTGMNG